MIRIKKDSIIRSGDILINPKNNEKWLVKTFEGHTFSLEHQQSGKLVQVKKNDLLAEPWQLIVGNGRGYW